MLGWVMLGWVGLCYDGQDVKITEGGKEEKGSSGIRLLGGGGFEKTSFMKRPTRIARNYRFYAISLKTREQELYEISTSVADVHKTKNVH